MNVTTQKFIEESGITRHDEVSLSVPGIIVTIRLEEDKDCTPSELLHKIVIAAKNQQRLNIFNQICNPVY